MLTLNEAYRVYNKCAPSHKVYVMVQNFPRFKSFIFLFFGGMVMYDDEFESIENLNQ